MNEFVNMEDVTLRGREGWLAGFLSENALVSFGKDRRTD